MMHEDVKSLRDTLLLGVAIDEQMSEVVARIADEAMRIGVPGFAAALLAVSRHHRVKAVEGRARIAALSGEYASLPTDGPDFE